MIVINCKGLVFCYCMIVLGIVEDKLFNEEGVKDREILYCLLLFIEDDGVDL